MRITRRAPSIKIGDTTYRFGKNGVSRSTKIANGIRIGTTATGHRYISGGKWGWRFYQDLDELDPNASKDQIKNARAQRTEELSLSLLLTHPLVFLDHLLRRKSRNSAPSQNSPLPQNSAPQSTPPLQNKTPMQSNSSVQNNSPLKSNFSGLQKKSSYSVKAEIFKEKGGVFVKVTEGTAEITSDRIIISANVEKQILFADISDVHIEDKKVFITSAGRNIPLVLGVEKSKKFMTELCNRITGR